MSKSTIPSAPSTHSRRIGIFILAALAAPALADNRASDPPFSAGTSYRLAGASVAWQTYIPQRSIDAIRHFYLVDEYIYGLGTNGWAYSIDACTGERRWSRPMVDEGYTLWPPVSGRRYQENTVAFTRLMSFSLLRLEDGMETLTYKLTKPSSCSVALTHDLAISSEVDRRLRAYDLADGYTSWMVDTKGELNLPPLIVSAARNKSTGSGSSLLDFLNREEPASAQQPPSAATRPARGTEFAEIVYFVDTTGAVRAGYASDKMKLFLTHVEGKPEGGLVADQDHLYVATSAQWVYALDRRKGDVTWRRRLSRKPEGLPVLVDQSLYIGLLGGGMELIDLSGDYPEITPLEGCRRFLAKWPSRIAMLDNEGRVALYQKQNWIRAATLEPGRFDLAISNPLNDAVFVGTARGVLLCIRPANHQPLAASDFLSADLKVAMNHLKESQEKEEAAKEGTKQNTSPQANENQPEKSSPPERIEDRILANPLRAR